MSPIGGTPVQGAFPLTGVDKLPHVSIAYPGEKWSDGKASGQIIPGQAVVTVASAGKLYVRPAAAGDAARLQQMAIAMRTVDVPDRNPGSQYQEALGPNEIRNLPIPNGDYVLRGYSGGFNLTLIDDDAAWAPSDLVGWDPAANAQPGKPQGVGAWVRGNGVIGPLFEVLLFRPVGDPALGRGILTVRSLRGQH